MPQIKRFKGLNNVSDPLRLGMQWLARADNINITDTGAIVKRDGYELSQAGVFTGVYTTQDFQRMYLVDGGALRTFDGAVLATGLSAAPMYWAEINEQVFFSNGADYGIVLPDNSVLEWTWGSPPMPTVVAGTGSLAAGLYRVALVTRLADGRRTGAGDAAEIEIAEGQSLIISDIPPNSLVYVAPANSDVFSLAGAPTTNALVWNFSPDNLGEDLLNTFLHPLPAGADVIAFHKGRAYMAHYAPNEGQTVVWFSEPLGFHLFDLNSNYFIVPGRVHMLADAETALLVGTDSEVFTYIDAKLDRIASYGIIPGQHWETDGDTPEEPRTYFWTTRGLCSALPFTNLTERQVSVAPGARAGGAIVRTGGQKRYVATLQQGGTAFNPY